MYRKERLECSQSLHQKWRKSTVKGTGDKHVLMGRVSILITKSIAVFLYRHYQKLKFHTVSQLMAGEIAQPILINNAIIWLLRA